MPKKRIPNKGPYRSWAYLSFEEKERWRKVFPNGKVPIKPIGTQRIKFEAFRDPESVFTVDCDVLDDCQLKSLSEKLRQISENCGGCFCLGRGNFGCLGVFENTFWVRRSGI